MTIRRQPADFVVEELAAPAFLDTLAPRGGPRCAHAVYALTKESLTTPDAAQRLARALRARPDGASYAGLKDKHARTTQLVSVLVRGPVPESAEGPGWSALRRGWSDAPVLSDAIDGNRFTIVVRDLTPDASADMARRASLLRADDAGSPALLVVNYFGAQRFGSARHGAGFIARRLIEGDFDGALRLAIGTPARKDTGATRALTRACAASWGDWADLLVKVPRCPERAAFEVLASGGTARDAFAALPRFTQTMAVEAYQSHLWNATARAMALEIARAEGSILRTPDEFGEMVFPAAAVVPGHAREMIVPLLAPKTALEGPWAGAARAALEAEGIDASKLRIPGLRRPFFGEAPRPLFALARRFTMTEPAPDELSRSGRLKQSLAFDLPRGAYATVVLRALGQ